MAGGLLLAALGYVMLLLVLDVGSGPSEVTFGRLEEDRPGLAIYVEPIAVDAQNEAMQVRFYFAPDRALRGTRPTSPNRDLNVVVTDGNAVQDLVFRNDEPMAVASMGVDLREGSIKRYPLDRYRATLRIQAFAGAPTVQEAEHGLPCAVTVWSGLPTFRVRITAEAGTPPGDITLGFDLRRTGGIVFFALAIYAAMAVLACSALGISTLVFATRQQAETALIGALAAMVFTVPLLRQVLPGAPPLGVLADLFVFLWAELAIVTALALFVFVWLRHRL